jgi:hypothetical protein
MRFRVRGRTIRVNVKRAMCYVDGFNLYHSISELKKPQLKWLDLWTLASRVLVDALTGLVDKQIVVTADTDQVPMFKQVRAVAPASELVLAVPPGRLSRAHALRAVASSYIDIHATRLGGCLLPRNVLNAAGKTIAVCPTDYIPT